MSLARSSIALGLLGVVIGACKTPTEVTIEIVSEIGYRPDMAIAVHLDRDGAVESAPPRIVTREAWPAGGTVGTVVAVRGGTDDDLMVRVVLATGREPSGCTANDAAGCIVVRRRIQFERGNSTSLRVVLRPACLAVFCDERTSCAADGRCGSLDSDVAFTDGGAVSPPDAEGTDLYARAVLADRPRHYYRFDEPAGSTVARDAVGRADGVYEGGVRLGVTGALRSSSNPGAFFDGAGNISIPKVDDFPGAMSIEVWARADTGDEPRPTLVERIDDVGGTLFGYRMSKPPGSALAFEVFRGQERFDALVPAIRFAGYAHFVAVVRGATLELWQDGVKKSTTPLLDTLPSSVVGPLLVGASRAGASPFRGAIDELALYDYPLAPEQIRVHKDASDAPPDAR